MHRNSSGQSFAVLEESEEEVQVEEVLVDNEGEPHLRRNPEPLAQETNEEMMALAMNAMTKMAEVHHEENITQKMEFQNRKHVNDGKKKIFLEAPNLEPSKALVEKEDNIKNEILELKSTLAELRKDGTILRSFVKYRTEPLFSNATTVNHRKRTENLNKSESEDASACAISKAEFEELKNIVTAVQGDIRTLKSTMQNGFAR